MDHIGPMTFTASRMTLETEKILKNPYGHLILETVHKYGFLENDYTLYMNDCGIVYTDEPILIVCFTDGQFNAYDVLGRFCTLMCDYAQYTAAHRQAAEGALDAALADLALPVFARNCREVMLLETKHFGTVAQIEVGAMLVGKIENHGGPGMPFRRGAEKGRFLYGGSTVVVLIEKDRVTLDEALFENTEKGLETPVVMGEALGAQASFF